MKTHTITINIDFDEILNYVYAHSAWLAAYNEKLRVLTPDSRGMLLLKMKEGYADLRQRVMGYLVFDNYNPNIESRNITMTFELKHEPSQSFGESLHDAIVAVLAHFVLMRFYGEIDSRGPKYGSSISYLEWRRFKAKLMLAFAHDEL